MADSFFTELKRRNVFKVGAAYLVLAWVVIQVTSEAVPALHLPDYVNTLVFYFGIIGFPFALFFAWAFEITPEGIKRESDISSEKLLLSETENKPKEIEQPKGKSIAVLPFINMSADAEQEFFCDGLTEELLNVIADLSELRVASRTSCFAFKKAQNSSLKEIANSLNVAHILEGSVRKSGNNIRITAQLIEVKSDAHLWSETYDRQIDDIFAIQDDIAKHILESLKMKLDIQSSNYLTTENSTAYNYFLMGMGKHESSRGSKDQASAIKLFQKAVSLDPKFIRAWVLIAESCYEHATFSIGSDAARALAKEAGNKAIELAPTYAESYLARGFGRMANKEYQEADKDFLKAIEYDSTLAPAYHNLARSKVFQGKSEEAVKYFAKGADLNFEDYESPTLAVNIYEKLGDKENAIKYAKMSVDRIKKHIEQYPNNARAYYLGTGGLLALGEVERAKEWAECAAELDASNSATQYNLACFYAQIGEIEKALDHLEGSITSKRWIEEDQDMDPLRNHPRFKAVLESLDD